MVGIANLLAGIDINPNGRHESAPSAMAGVKARSNYDQNDDQNSSIKSLACRVSLMAEHFSKQRHLTILCFPRLHCGW
jgi:hypothetical protein